ncbi:MAG: trypsin-like peptidase domain-containing protein [Candidatus Moraniibacteriota bacterium]
MDINKDTQNETPEFSSQAPESLIPAQAESVTPRRCHRHHSWLSVVVLSIVFGFVGAGLAIVGIARMNNPWLQRELLGTSGNALTSVTGVRDNPEVVSGDDQAVITMVDKVNPSVVSIVISQNVSNLRQQMPFGFPFFFPLSPNDGSAGNTVPKNGGGTTKQQVGSGSGFFVSSDGLIVTNKHVVSDTTASYTVITSDGKEHPAKVIAQDLVRDIALIKISDVSNSPALDLGTSADLKVGQTVIAIGNSLGEFSNTVTKGIVSGLQRDLTAGSGRGGESEQLSNIIQTDAAINPGNSGGPLVDIAGRVIGVNVAIAQGAQSIGFAIPIDQVKKIINQVQTTGKISTPYLGVRYVIIDQDFQKANNLSVDHGALIARGNTTMDLAIVPGSPADKAGLAENDIILEVNGQAIDTKHPLNDLLTNYNAGDTITLKILHRGDTKDISVPLGERK